MSRGRVFVTLFALAAAAGACEKKPVEGGTSELVPSRAAATGEFPDNALLAYIPADTPYAFATFKPVPVAYLEKMFSVMGPSMRQMLAKTSARLPDSAAMAAAIDRLEKLDAKQVEEAGFSPQARFVTYGLGVYPVMRFELLNGDRVFEVAQRAAANLLKETIPPPTERAGSRYWTVDISIGTVFVAIAAKQMIVAFGPRAVIDGNLAALLGEQRPAKALTTAQFRDLAERDGFTGQGVGWADLSRLSALIAGSAGAGPDCSAAIAAIAKRAPRIALGYDDITPHRLGAGIVVELDPALIADVRGLSGSIVGLDRVIRRKPAMAFAVAANVERGRALLSRVAGTVQELGQRCELSALAGVADKLATAATVPLPPAAAGLHGGYFAFTDFKMGRHGPDSFEGFGAIQLDHAPELLKLATSAMPDIDTSADSKAHPLPATARLPGHFAANDHAIGFAVGTNTATTAVEALDGTASPAPLMMMLFDYRRLGDFMRVNPDADTLALQAMVKMFGLGTFQVVADQRGLVTWMTIEMN